MFHSIYKNMHDHVLPGEGAGAGHCIPFLLLHASSTQQTPSRNPGSFSGYRALKSVMPHTALGPGAALQGRLVV